MNHLKSIFSRKPPGVGVELTPERVNIARLRRQRHQLKLETLYSEDIPEGLFTEGQIVDSGEMAAVIHSALSESKLKAKRVTSAIPGRAITRVISMPSELDDAELREMVLNQEASLYPAVSP